MIKIILSRKFIYFENKKTTEAIKNDGPYFIKTASFKMKHDYQNSFKIKENIGHHTTINFHTKEDGIITENYDFWDKIKQYQYSFLYLYNPKYNRYIHITFDKLRTIKRRK